MITTNFTEKNVQQSLFEGLSSFSNHYHITVSHFSVTCECCDLLHNLVAYVLKIAYFFMAFIPFTLNLGEYLDGYEFNF